MSTRDLDGVVKEFLVESYENLDRFERDLSTLQEKPASRETLASVFRTIHTIKGACGFLGYGKLESVAHAGENLLSKLRDGRAVLEPAMTAALFDVARAVREMLATIESTGSDGSRSARLEPIGNILSKVPRMASDLSALVNKKVRVELEGNATELDRITIEAIKDPLAHIIRNAVDHGIEAPDVRAARGKPEEGFLLLRAHDNESEICIEVSDDGNGIDVEKVKNKAVASGMIASGRAANMNDREAMELLFLPGFSMAERISNISGRGVGLDVVKTNIERVGGTVEISSRAGKGTSIKIKIPRFCTLSHS
ncbi:MAG: chemotaxis protein CheA [Planctomycetota bacterium]